jgi:hypothetical protein
VFGCKNLGLSFYRPGSLVVLASAVCCLFLDADTLAVLKAAYSLHGQTLGKRGNNKTVARQLRKHQKSILAAAGALVPEVPLPQQLGPSRNTVAPDKELAMVPAAAAEMQQDDAPHQMQLSVTVEELGLDDGAMADAAPGCAPFDLRTGSSQPASQIYPQ